MGIIGKVSGLTQNPNKSLRKEAFWILSNIAASSGVNFGKVLSEEGLLGKIIECVCNLNEDKVRNFNIPIFNFLGCEKRSDVDFSEWNFLHEHGIVLAFIPA